MTTTSDPAAEVVARLSEGAEAVDSGRFTVDPEVARRKLREHRFESRGAWAPLLVEVAELAGVDRVEVDEGIVGVRVRLLGGAVERLAPPAEVAGLFSWAFGRGTSDDGDASALDEARRLLALAINEASSRPVELTVTTAAGGMRLEIGEDDLVAEPVAAAAACLEITVRREMPELAQLEELGEVVSGAIELHMIIDCAGWGRVPVEVAGRVLGRPMPKFEQCRLAMPIVLDGREVGYAGLRDIEDELPKVDFVTNGVWVCSRKLSSSDYSPFFAVIHDGFERDLSLGDVVENDAYQQLRMIVYAAKSQLEAELDRGRVRPAVDPTGDVFETSFSLAMLARPLSWAAVGLGLVALGSWFMTSGEPGSRVAPVVLTVVAAGLGAGAVVLRRRLALFGGP